MKEYTKKDNFFFVYHSIYKKFVLKIFSKTIDKQNKIVYNIDILERKKFGGKVYGI